MDNKQLFMDGYLDRIAEIVKSLTKYYQFMDIVGAVR
jgi:hypothetical protein